MLSHYLLQDGFVLNDLPRDLTAIHSASLISWTWDEVVKTSGRTQSDDPTDMEVLLSCAHPSHLMFHHVVLCLAI